MKPFTILSVAMITAVFFSCNKKAETEDNSFSEAAYKVEITGKWKSPEFAVPANVHYTYFTGMVHNNQTYLWKEGALASIGVENIAETGYFLPMFAEIDSLTAIKKAIYLSFIAPPAATGISSGNIYCNSNYPYFSCQSMLAPTPDWFVGLSSFNLYPNKQWVKDTTINLYAYDAGTEDGDMFNQTNADSSPHQPIFKLTTKNGGAILANGNPVLGAIASIRLIKQ
jgi:hypothetical protein